MHAHVWVILTGPCVYVDVSEIAAMLQLHSFDARGARSSRFILLMPGCSESECGVVSWGFPVGRGALQHLADSVLSCDNVDTV